MKNKILFDLTATQASHEAKFHGGGEYAKMVFFKAIEKGHSDFDCIYNSNLELDDKIKNYLIEYNIKSFDVTTVWETKKLIIKEGYNLFYSAIPYHYGNLNIKSCKFLMVIHGLRSIECPFDTAQTYYVNGYISLNKLRIRNLLLNKFSQKRRHTEFEKLIANNNKLIITVSNHSKYSILSNFPQIKQSEVEVFHSPIDLFDEFKISNNEFKKYGSYFLLISANRWIKNNFRAVKALDNLITKGLLPDKKVVVLGANGIDWNVYIQNLDCFIFLDYVSKSELSHFFSNAYAFIYPTLNEGFGYPPLNAMSNSVPVLASGHSSVIEVCRDGCLYFNPYSIKEIEVRVLNLVSEKNTYNDLVKKGLNRVKYLMKINKDMQDQMISRIFDELI